MQHPNLMRINQIRGGKRVARCLVHSIALAAAVLFAGCGDDGPTGPGDLGGGGGSGTWEWVHPRPAGHFLHDATFLTPSVGLAVGTFGSVLRTVDGGANWTVRYPTHRDLSAIAFSNSSTGLAVGPGAVLRTTDAGLTWTDFGTTRPYTEIAFDGGAALAVFDQGPVSGRRSGVDYSADNGETWTETLNTGSIFTDVAKRGDFAIATTSLGKIYRSIDGGATWDSVAATGAGLFRVEFASNTRAFAVGGKMFRTDDGGETWQELPAIADVSSYNGLAFATSLVGYVSARKIGEGIILETTDGGDSWTEKGTLGDTRAPSLTATGDGQLHRVFYASVLQSSDGGSTWDELTYSVTNHGPIAVSVVGGTIDCLASRSFFRSQDGGATWTDLEGPGIISPNGMDFFDTQHGVVVGHPGAVYFTDDGGQTWEDRGYTSSTLWDAHMFSPTEVIVVGAGSDDIIYTDDAGQSWELRPSPNTGNLTSLSFVDDNTGVVSGYSHVATTSNRGEDWTVRSAPSSLSRPQDVVWRGDVILLVQDDIVGRSSDGGASWTTTTIPDAGTLLAVAFRDDNTAFATTKTGQIFRSDDAGQTWELDAHPLSVGLGDIVFTENGTGIAVGGIGGVLRMR